MTADPAAKLPLIAGLTEGELRGWWREIFVHRARAPFEGERDALLARAAALGLTMKGA